MALLSWPASVRAIQLKFAPIFESRTETDLPTYALHHLDGLQLQAMTIRGSLPLHRAQDHA